MRGSVARKAPSTKRTRTGKISKIEEEQSLSVLKKILFILLLAVILVVASGIIITIGPMPSFPLRNPWIMSYGRSVSPA